MRMAVIGGAASAVCIIDALAQSTANHGILTVFEPSEWLWRGRAYQNDSEVVLANAPVEDMSVRDGDDQHFLRWLRSQGVDIDSSGFVPRAMFGNYLEHSAAHALSMLQVQGWHVEVVREAVVEVLPGEYGMCLSTTSGLYGAFETVILAVGGGEPEDIFRLAGVPGYIGDPYPTNTTLNAIGGDDDVAVVGTGLTAVDVVRALAARQHRGRITLLSRLGVLPAVRQRHIPHALTAFTPDEIYARAGAARQVEFSDVVELLSTELSTGNADIEEISQEVSAAVQEPVKERLRRQLQDVGSNKTGLRIVQKAVPECGPDLWPLLPERVHKVLLGSHYRVLMSLCCPMPPQSAAVMMRLIEGGKLDVQGGLRVVTPAESDAGGGFRIDTDAGSFRTQHLVNAVSAPAHRVPPRAQRLLDSLCEQKLGVRHPQGGLAVHTSNSRLVGEDSGADIYAVGDLAGGTFFFTFGVPSLVDRARDVVADVLLHATRGATGEPSDQRRHRHLSQSEKISIHSTGGSIMTETKAAHLADTTTGLPIPAGPSFASVAEERHHRKQRLAAAVRLFGRSGFGEGISGHISVRDPGDPNLFWVNPFGFSFNRVRVADLICVGTDGTVVEGEHAVNPSAFAIHSEIHQRCPDAEAVAHGHTINSRALGALGRLLEPVDQESAAFYQNQVLYSDYDGPAITIEQGKDIADKLFGKTAILLRHHGLITAGASLEEAVHWFFTFDSCAEVQLLARAAGGLEIMTGEQAAEARAGFGDRQLAWFSFQLMWDEICHEHPEFLEE